MINAGAFLGQFMTAQLRDTVQCFGDDCYLLPYLILVGFMIVSTTIFALGEFAGRQRTSVSLSWCVLLGILCGDGEKIAGSLSYAFMGVCVGAFVSLFSFFDACTSFDIISFSYLSVFLRIC